MSVAQQPSSSSGEPSSEMYNGLAVQAAEAGQDDLADRLFEYAGRVAWENEGGREKRIELCVVTAIETFQALITLGDKQAAAYSRLHSFPNEEDGVNLFDGLISDTTDTIAVPVLKRVYERLGVAEARDQAVATKKHFSGTEFSETKFKFTIPGGITLTEIHHEQEGRVWMIGLWGHKRE
jgi:hypothetical protein